MTFLDVFLSQAIRLVSRILLSSIILLSIFWDGDEFYFIFPKLPELERAMT
jgi:hypothetical protein